MKWKNRLIDAGILLAVFIAAVVIFSGITNQGNDNMTADMDMATFPQVSFAYEGYHLNSLPGYAQKMDLSAMRDTITPVSGQQLQLDIERYENNITSMRYRVYSLNGDEKLLDTKVKKPEDTLTLEIGEDLLEGERLLEVVLNIDGEWSVYFYTRIRSVSRDYMLASLEYIENFHEGALDKAEGAGVGAALEPSEEVSNTSFRHVTIHSDYDHVSWGELEPTVEQGERWNIKEINDNYVSAQLEFRVSCKGEENERDSYRVKEFFRIRHVVSQKHTFLLDYDRTMEQMLTPSDNVLSENGVLLGITNPDMAYLVNGDGTIVSFVTANELWNYNKNTDELSLLFSFNTTGSTDARNLTLQHEIKLLDIDKDGNTTFGVYGYMNRGAHEGEVGAAIYYYDISQNSVDEKVFVSTKKMAGIAEKELGQFSYYNVSQNMFYALIDGTLYEYNVENGYANPLVEGMEAGQYVISEDGHLVAYQVNEEESTAQEVQVMNLDTGNSHSVTCQEEEALYPLGFVKNDFVYGVANVSDEGETVSGESVHPMYKIEIQSSKEEIVKTYEVKGSYVVGAQFEDNMITLSRVSKEGSTYNNISPDYITNNEEKEESNIYLESYTTELKETQMRLTYANGIADKEPKLLKPKQIIFENPRTLSFDEEQTAQQYYVYGYGEMQAICDQAGEAIVEAARYNGVVVSADQEYIWEKGNQDLQHTISGKDTELSALETGLKNKEAPVKLLEALHEGSSLNLTGCTADQLLYLIGTNRPVIGMLDIENAVILVGYDSSNVTYIDVEDGSRHTVTYKRMDEMTEGSGNTYVG